MNEFRNIVVGVDVSGREHLVGARELSRFSRAALSKAAWMARRNDARLHVLTSLDVDPHAEEMIRRDESAGGFTVLDRAMQRLQHIAAPFRDDGLDVTCEVAFGPAKRAVLRDVVLNERDLAVVGTRERSSLARNLLGSTALWLIRKAPCPVWVARAGPGAGFEHVVAPVDFGSLAPRIIKTANAIATGAGARLHVLHVVDYGAEAILRSSDVPEATIADYRRERGDAARSRFEELARTSLGGEAGDHVDLHQLAGNPAEEIVQLADDLAADLVVVGTVTDDALEGLLLGSTAEAVLPHLEASLLVLKPDGFVSPVRVE